MFAAAAAAVLQRGEGGGGIQREKPNRKRRSRMAVLSGGERGEPRQRSLRPILWDPFLSHWQREKKRREIEEHTNWRAIFDCRHTHTHGHSLVSSSSSFPLFKIVCVFALTPPPPPPSALSK